VQLSEYLIKYFNNFVNSINNNDDDNDIDEYSLINNIINTFCNFAHYFVNDEGIYPKIENYIDILINFCINVESDNKLEEGLGLMNEILSNCKKLPNHIIKFFIPLINLIIEEKDIDLYGNENLSTITQLLCFYISKDSDEVLINFIDKEGKHEYINYILKFIHFIIIQCDKVNNDYYEYTYIFYICNNLFDRYKNKV
jgi:hypothetical protein